MAYGRISIVVGGALLITVLGAYASDSVRGGGLSQLGQLIGAESSVCGTGMVVVPTALSFTCVDRYEASPAEDCPQQTIEGVADTDANVVARNCRAGSEASALPWRYINREQASLMCARAGKRLPTALEWYQFAIDTPENKCRTNTSVGKAGEAVECASAFGVHDAVGNVWEWVSDDVIDGVYNMRSLPTSGYVAQVDSGGVATVAADQSTDQYGGDYLWSNTNGSFGMLRGGFYGSERDAGVYAVQAETPPNFSGEAVGFRCVL